MNLLDLLGPILAAAGTAVVLLGAAAAVSLWKLEAGRRIASWVAPAAAFLTGSLLVRGVPPFPPVEAAGWIWWATGAAALVGAVSGRRSHGVSLTACLLAVGFLVYLLLRPLMGRTFEGVEAVLIPVAAGAIWLFVWTSFAQSRRSPAAWSPLLLLLISSVGLSILLMVAGTASYAQYALALSGGLAGAFVAALPPVRRWAPDPQPAAGAAAIPWGGLLLAGYFYADVPLAAALAIAASTLPLFAPLLPKLRETTSRRWFPLIQLGWCALAVGAAILTAYAKAPSFDY